MKNSSKIGAFLIAMVFITSCASFEAQYCKKDRRVDKPNPAGIQENDSITTFNLNGMSNDSSKFEFNSESPLVCLLTGAEQAERKELLQKEIFSRTKKIQEIENGFIFHFNYDENFIMKMTDYVIAENNCCPFLTFETKLHAKDDITLKVFGSSIQAKEMIKMTLVDRK